VNDLENEEASHQAEFDTGFAWDSLELGKH
jgi:hypothetical protein